MQTNKNQNYRFQGSDFFYKKREVSIIMGGCF